MPGLVGLIGNMPRGHALLKLEQMLDALSYESFYSRGTYSNEELGFYAGWVVHPDSFCDGLPAQTENGNLTLLLSGEVFASRDTVAADIGEEDSNVRQLAAQCERLGDRFFSELNGTFSGLIADSRVGTVSLFNDRLGYEKVFYCKDSADGNFCFSSEAKALLRVVPQSRDLDRHGLAQFLQYGCTFGDKTIYKGISLLPPASVWKFSGRKSTPAKTTYFHPQDWQIDSTLDSQTYQQRFGDTFCKVLPKYFAGKLRPSLSLTGGWDTRMILAGHHLEPKMLPCYTFAGPSGDTVDVQQARKVAEAVHQDYSVLRLQSDFFGSFADHAEKTIYVSDGYGGIGLSHEIYLNRLARDVAGVRLTGNFGSEVLRGVTTFKETPLQHQWYVGELSHELHNAKEEFNSTRRESSAAQFATFKEIPQKLATTARLANSQLPFRTPFMDIEILRLACACPPGISGTSLPPWFVGQLRPDLLLIPTDQGESPRSGGLGGSLRKAWFKGTFKLDYWASEGAPGLLGHAIDDWRFDRLLPRRHRYLDYRRWLRGPLKRYTEDLLTGSNSFSTGLIGRKAVDQLLKEHVTGKRNALADITALMNLELINRCLLRAPQEVHSV
jgi:asparagine synthase (glutamine-hydrolysing)